MYTQTERKKVPQSTAAQNWVAKPSVSSQERIPNSAMLPLTGDTTDGSNVDVLGERVTRRLPSVRIQPQSQIISAEDEADRLSASVTGGSPDSIKASLGRRMGADFSGVRFHTDEDAAAKADSMGARAFTSGADVYFGSLGFDPSVAAHELVHTAQQGMVASETSVQSTPVGGVQMDPLTSLDMKKMNFGKRAYKGDKDYQRLRGLMEAFNQSGGSQESRMALMEEAMQYIDKFSTGKKAKHKGRTSMAEDILYQLSTDSGEKDAAAANLGRFHDKVASYGDTSGGTNTPQSRSQMDRALTEMGKMSSGEGGRYSKAMQMTMTGVLSQLGNVSEVMAGGASGTKRDLGDDQYLVTGRSTGDLSDTIGTTLHELTHAATGQVFDNTTALFSIGQGASADEVRARRDDNARRMKEIAAASKAGPRDLVDDTASDVQKLGNWIDGSTEGDFSARKNYGLGAKMFGSYIPGQKKKAMREIKTAQGHDMSHASDNQLKALLPEYDQAMGTVDSLAGMSEGKKRDIKKNDIGFRQMENALGGSREHTDALIEYDPVINQIFAQYEQATDDRSSEFYRKTKAAALRSHVHRQKQLMQTQIAQRPASQPVVGEKTSDQSFGYRTTAVPQVLDPTTASEDEMLATMYQLIKNPRPGDDEETISARKRHFAELRAQQMKSQERAKTMPVAPAKKKHWWSRK